MRIIAEPDRPRASTGSPEALVRTLTDLELQDPSLVRALTRGSGWGTEPERFERAAAAELAWRREQGVTFGWVRP
jgi:hypothetical protein